MNKFRKFVNIKGFSEGILYVLYNKDTKVFCNVTANCILDEGVDSSGTFIRYAENFCKEGSWKEVEHTQIITSEEFYAYKELVKAAMFDLYIRMAASYFSENTRRISSMDMSTINQHINNLKVNGCLDEYSNNNA